MYTNCKTQRFLERIVDDIVRIILYYYTFGRLIHFMLENRYVFNNILKTAVVKYLLGIRIKQLFYGICQ